MAKTIVTYCDRHLSDGQEVDATAIQLSIDGRAVEIDLCDECRTDVLGPVIQLLTEHGQPVKSDTGRARVECPECHKTYSNNKGLRDHLRRQHPDARLNKGAVAAGADPTAEGEYPCPDCDRKFLRPQAVGAHRARIHGYVSPQNKENVATNKRRRGSKKAAAA